MVTVNAADGVAAQVECWRAVIFDCPDDAAWKSAIAVPGGGTEAGGAWRTRTAELLTDTAPQDPPGHGERSTSMSSPALTLIVFPMSAAVTTYTVGGGRLVTVVGGGSVVDGGTVVAGTVTTGWDVVGTETGSETSVDGSVVG